MEKTLNYFSELKIREKKKSLKVGVIAGGISSEREISLKTGMEIYKSLLNSGYRAFFIDLKDDFCKKLEAIDLAFLALHGKYGEDGTVQELLEILDPTARLQRLGVLLARELDVLELEHSIQDRVQQEVDRSQRELFLREQMRAIQTELGEVDAHTAEVQELEVKVAEMDLEENITFFPFTNEPAHVFEVIDILVLSSLYKEGLPNVILEAMSMGLPVVASRMAGVPEVVINGRTGWMTEPGDVHGLADAVERLWEDPAACREMGNEARSLMEESFDKVHQFDAFLDHFEMITARPW